jgi:hypothetical protein
MLPDPSAASLPPAHSDERVLVWTPSGRDAALASTICQRLGLGTHTSASADALLSEVEQGAAVLLLAEDALDGPTMTGLVHRLQTQPAPICRSSSFHVQATRTAAATPTRVPSCGM